MLKPPVDGWCWLWALDVPGQGIPPAAGCCPLTSAEVTVQPQQHQGPAGRALGAAQSLQDIPEGKERRKGKEKKGKEKKGKGKKGKGKGKRKRKKERSPVLDPELIQLLGCHSWIQLHHSS